MAKHFAHTYTDDTQQCTLRLMMEPRRWIHRVSESFETGENTIRCDVVLDLTIPSAPGTPEKSSHTTNRLLRLLEPAPVAIPLMIPQRGQTIDGLEVFDAENRLLPIMCNAEQSGLACILLAGLAVRAAGVRVIADLNDTEQQYVLDVSNIADLSEADAKEQVESLFCPTGKNIEEPLTALNRMRYNFRLRTVADQLASHYVLFTEIPHGLPGTRQIIRYRYNVSYDTCAAPGWPKSLQRRLGQRPHTFLLRAPHVRRCDSYDLVMVGPRNHSVARQYFVTPEVSDEEGVNTPLVMRQFEFSPPAVYVGKDREETPYARLHVAGADPKSIPYSLFVRVIFYERFPGILSVALGLDVALLLLLLISAVYPTQLASSDASGVLAALFLIPGTGAFWVRHHGVSGEFLAGPLSARVALLATQVVSFSMTLLLVLVHSNKDGGLSDNLLRAVIVLMCLALLAPLTRVANGLRRNYRALRHGRG